MIAQTIREFRRHICRALALGVGLAAAGDLYAQAVSVDGESTASAMAAPPAANPPSRPFSQLDLPAGHASGLVGLRPASR
jgi:hypothetical protein